MNMILIIHYSNTTLLLDVKSVLQRLLIAFKNLKLLLLIFCIPHVIRDSALGQDSASESWRVLTIILIATAGAPPCR